VRQFSSSTEDRDFWETRITDALEFAASARPKLIEIHSAVARELIQAGMLAGFAERKDAVLGVGASDLRAMLRGDAGS
jgi:hypothetical protein